MLGWAISFLVIAIIAAVFGFGGIAAASAGIAKLIFFVFLALFAIGGLLLAMLGLDPISAFSASAACLGNIGPGFGAVGAAQTYEPLPWAAKLILAVQMIVGRLELYTVLVLLFLGRRGLRA